MEIPDSQDPLKIAKFVEFGLEYLKTIVYNMKDLLLFDGYLKYGVSNQFGIYRFKIVI